MASWKWRSREWTVLAALAGLLMTGCAGPGKPTTGGENGAKPAVVPSLTPAMRANPQEKDVISQSNDFRRELGLRVLRADSRLMEIAQRHAANMAGKDRFGDTDRNGHVMDGLDPGDRVQVGGYAFARVAENVGWQLGKSDPVGSMMDDWKKSPGHRKNLLIAEVVDIGVGVAKGRSGRWYFVQLFGKPYESTRRVTSRMLSMN